MKKWLITLGPLLVFLALRAAAPAQADRLESDSYTIQFGNFNMGSGKGTGSSYGLTYTLGQTAPGPFGAYGSSNYFVGSGFQYIYQIDTFGFTIDKIAIDLGELVVGTHNSASNVISITTKGAGGYSVYAYEQKPLTHSNDTNTIADTTCDAGSCNQAIAGVWSNQSIPGFGFNVTGNDAAADFLDGSYFRQFANDAAAEEMQVIMSDTDIASNEWATITYKAGVDGSTAAGNYQTGIVYVAVPGY